MANSWYNDGLKALATAALNWPGNGNIKVAAMQSAYTPSITDSGWNTISGNVEGTPVALGTLTQVNGQLSAGSLTYPISSSGDTVSSFVVYDSSGPNGGTLLWFYDTIPGMPFVTSAVPAILNWNGISPTGLMATV